MIRVLWIKKRGPLFQVQIFSDSQCKPYATAISFSRAFYSATNLFGSTHEEILNDVSN